MINVKPPADLGTAGRALWRSTVRWLAEQTATMEPHETVVLAEACRTADRLAALRAALTGVDLADPAAVRLLTEERLQRQALASLLCVRLGLPTGLSDSSEVARKGRKSSLKGTTSTSRRAVRAARARWGTTG